MAMSLQVRAVERHRKAGLAGQLDIPTTAGERFED